MLAPHLQCRIITTVVDMANINISWNEEDTSQAVKAALNGDNPVDTSAVAWHYDSFPFVCVAMLSDCADMVGGETAVRLPNGENRKVRGPSMVSHQLFP